MNIDDYDEYELCDKTRNILDLLRVDANMVFGMDFAIKIDEIIKGDKMKFRKKPVVIDAIQWLGVKKVVRDFFGEFKKWSFNDEFTGKPTISIQTLEGTHIAQPNDWIIKSIKGEFYPCKPDIFEATYDKV